MDIIGHDQISPGIVDSHPRFAREGFGSGRSHPLPNDFYEGFHGGGAAPSHVLDSSRPGYTTPYYGDGRHFVGPSRDTRNGRSPRDGGHMIYDHDVMDAPPYVPYLVDSYERQYQMEQQGRAAYQRCRGRSCLTPLVPMPDAAMGYPPSGSREARALDRGPAVIPITSPEMMNFFLFMMLVVVCGLFAHTVLDFRSQLARIKRMLTVGDGSANSTLDQV